ncbi:MAG: hypothetical protein RL748_442 [Pseudomonadota bacterium]
MLILMMAVLTAQAMAQSANPAQAESESDLLYIEALKLLSEGRKGEASQTLTQLIAKAPYHAGAFMELAMIQCQLGHGAEAEVFFKAVEQRFNPEPWLLDLIAYQRKLGCKQFRRQSHASLSLARGYDQNVNQGSSSPVLTLPFGTDQIQLQLSPEFLPRPDHFTSLNADYALELTQNGGQGFVQLSMRHNDELNRFNNSALFFGFEQGLRWRNWAGRTSLLTGWIRLGDALYQHQTQAQLRINPPVALPAAWQFGVSGTLSHNQYLTLSNYNANTIDLRSHLGYRSAQSELQSSLAYSIDRGNNLRPGGERRGWLSSIQWRTRIDEKWLGDLTWNHQSWRSQSDYSPGFINRKRNQDTDIVRAALQYSLSSRQSLQLEWRQTWNRENISIFQYQNRQVQLSWLWHY